MVARNVPATALVTRTATGHSSWVQARINRFMRHRYTWTPRVSDVRVNPGIDDWGNPIQTTDSPPAPTPATGKICLFKDKAVVLLGPDGPMQAETNEIAIPWDDPLAIGDYISDIVDPVTGHHFIDQPIRVETIEDHAPKGVLIYRRAHLRYAEVQ